MPPKCSICIHPKRTEINRLLLSESESLRNIAERFGTGVTSLHRHRSTHMPGQVAKAAKQREDADVGTAIDVRAQLKAINGVALNILRQARDRGDDTTALQAMDRVQKQIELQARIIDLINDGTTVDIQITTQWMDIRTVILSALEPYPEARAALSAALEKGMPDV